MTEQEDEKGECIATATRGGLSLRLAVCTQRRILRSIKKRQRLQGWQPLRVHIPVICMICGCLPDTRQTLRSKTTTYGSYEDLDPERSRRYVNVDSRTAPNIIRKYRLCIAFGRTVLANRVSTAEAFVPCRPLSRSRDKNRIVGTVWGKASKLCTASLVSSPTPSVMLASCRQSKAAHMNSGGTERDLVRNVATWT